MRAKDGEAELYHILMHQRGLSRDIARRTIVRYKRKFREGKGVRPNKGVSKFPAFEVIVACEVLDRFLSGIPTSNDILQEICKKKRKDLLQQDGEINVVRMDALAQNCGALPSELAASHMPSSLKALKRATFCRAYVTAM